MAELIEAYKKLNQENNKLFYFLSKTPVKRNKQELKVNDETNEYEWHNDLNLEFIETLNIELPITTEVHWELFSDEGYSDKGSIQIVKESLNQERFLTFKVNPDKEGNNFFINLKCLIMENNNSVQQYSNNLDENKKYESYNCFISLNKLKELSNNLTTSS